MFFAFFQKLVSKIIFYKNVYIVKNIHTMERYITDKYEDRVFIQFYIGVHTSQFFKLN